MWGILAILGMIVAFFPCLGALNWLNIPFSGLGIIIAAIALATARSKARAALSQGSSAALLRYSSASFDLSSAVAYSKRGLSCHHVRHG